jgi:hypothetical protein
MAMTHSFLNNGQKIYDSLAEAGEKRKTAISTGKNKASRGD